MTKLQMLAKKIKSKHTTTEQILESDDNNMANCNIKLSKSFKTSLSHNKNAKVSPSIKSRRND